MIVVMLRWLLLFSGTPLLFAQTGGQAGEIRKTSAGWKITHDHTS
jgi:hypothetical protein